MASLAAWRGLALPGTKDVELKGSDVEVEEAGSLGSWDFLSGALGCWFLDVWFHVHSFSLFHLLFGTVTVMFESI